jgi:antitoxin (DNA-binding transcriptional repressor) of toxin-antitoxin stability system
MDARGNTRGIGWAKRFFGLRYNFPAVERMLLQGETIEITKRKRVIGQLVPVAPKVKPKMPDFMARLRRIYGNKVLTPSGAEL